MKQVGRSRIFPRRLSRYSVFTKMASHRLWITVQPIGADRVTVAKDDGPIAEIVDDHLAVATCTIGV